MRMVIHDKKLYAAPGGRRAAALLDPRLLMLTCTGVSFAHGSNDGQKGMGLIMLILIGTVPTAYALNHAVSAPRRRQDFVAGLASGGSDVLDALRASDARGHRRARART